MNCKDYFDEMTRVLMAFQFIEEVLKMHINTADIAIHIKLKGMLRYDLRPKQLWKKPLGLLIEDFDRISEDKDLVKRLKELVKERNFFAHSGYLFSPEGDTRDKEIKELLPKLKGIHRRASQCLADIVISTSKLRKEPIDEDLLAELLNT